MTKLSQDDFDRLKKRLYGAKNSLENALKHCPELNEFSIELMDGHHLSPREILAWLEKSRSKCWEFGPQKSQRRHMEDLIRQQPHG